MKNFKNLLFIIDDSSEFSNSSKMKILYQFAENY
jgi:hypothetical protein